MALRWKKQPNREGLERIGQGPRGWQLSTGKEIVMHVAPVTPRFDRFTVVGWYFYGCDHNSYATPCETAEQAKEQAKEFYLKTQEKNDGKDNSSGSR